MEEHRWIAISYALPREPSRPRVAIWRKLKKIGAVNMQQSLWVLPASDESRAFLDEIKEDVVRGGGEAFVLSFSADADGDARIRRKISAEREAEYGELFEQCEDFFTEIDKETTRGNFTFAEIEENEEELAKLETWYRKIAARDIASSSLRDKAEALLAECKRQLDGFCNRVYELNEEPKARP